MKRTVSYLVATLLLISAVAALAAGHDDNLGNPGVAPPHSLPYGKSYSEWSREWWVYSIATPLSVNPFGNGTDPTYGQSGPVWFLGGTFTGANLTRQVTVPAGKALFFPVTDVECSTVETPASGFHGDNEGQLRACAMSWTDRALSGEWGPVTCTVDGVALKNLDQYRFSTPLMHFILPAMAATDNVFGMPVAEGQEVLSVGDGIYVLLNPLPVGTHTIEFQSIHYTITVSGRPGLTDSLIEPPYAMPYGKTYGEWGMAFWKWVFDNPVSQNPLFMDGKVDLSLNQPAGPVWFIGGTFIATPDEIGGGYIGRAVRTGTIPADKALFFPILNNEFDNQTFVPPTSMSIPELYTYAAQSIAGNQSMNCEIDGVAVRNLWNATTKQSPYLVLSPVFNYWLPPTDNVQQFWGVNVSGWIGPGVGEGVYLMLAPLSVGRHTIHFWGGSPGNFMLDITYNLKVVPNGNGEEHRANK